MTSSTPPAWQWLEERYVPVPYPGAFAAMAEDQYESLALSTDPLNLPDADTLGDQNDSEPPIDSRKTPVSAALRERNGHDPTGEDIWPLDRDQCPDCRCAPDRQHDPDCAGVQSVRETPTNLRVGAPNEHPACDCTAQNYNEYINAAPEHPAWICSDCGEAVYGKRCAPSAEPCVSTWHMDTCGICGETKAVTEPRDFGDGGTDCTPNPFPGGIGAMLDEAASLGFDVPLDKVAADETTSPADSSCVKCPVCCRPMPDGETILCDYCEESIGVESFTVVRGPGSVNVYHLPCYDEVYWDGQEPANKTLDTLDPTLDTEADKRPISGHNEGTDIEYEYGPEPIPFKTQEWIFESLAECELVKLHDLMDDHHDLILEMARDRFRKGFAKFGSEMYSWTAERRLDETLQELADSTVYLTSGPVE